MGGAGEKPAGKRLATEKRRRMDTGLQAKGLPPHDGGKERGPAIVWSIFSIDAGKKRRPNDRMCGVVSENAVCLLHLQQCDPRRPISDGGYSLCRVSHDSPFLMIAFAIVTNMDLSELLAKDGSGDLPRSIAEVVLELIMGANVDGPIDTGHHEHHGGCTTWRNKCRDRSLDTRLGTLKLEVPKMRQGSYFHAKALVNSRTDVAGFFPNDDAIIRLVGAIMLEANDERTVARRYTSLETLARVNNNPDGRLSAVAS
jgi:hypothetical protein